VSQNKKKKTFEKNGRMEPPPKGFREMSNNRRLDDRFNFSNITSSAVHLFLFIAKLFACITYWYRRREQRKRRTEEIWSEKLNFLWKKRLLMCVCALLLCWRKWWRVKMITRKSAVNQKLGEIATKRHRMTVDCLLELAKIELARNRAVCCCHWQQSLS
jgi:hypothetical protein